eukprot:3009613-Amphidinium_carterae.1
MVKWLGPLRRPARRRLMALRGRLLSNGSPNDIMIEAAAADYRPLRQIQEFRLQARWGGHRRWVSARRNRCKVLCNPG